MGNLTSDIRNKLIALIFVVLVGVFITGGLSFFRNMYEMDNPKRAQLIKAVNVVIIAILMIIEFLDFTGISMMVRDFLSFMFRR